MKKSTKAITILFAILVWIGSLIGIIVGNILKEHLAESVGSVVGIISGPIIGQLIGFIPKSWHVKQVDKRLKKIEDIANDIKEVDVELKDKLEKTKRKRLF